MKAICTILLLVSSLLFANNCKDWRNNSDNCLYDTTLTRPIYANTEDYMEAGQQACRTYNEQYYTVKDSLVSKSGLLFSVKRPRKICREIEYISHIKIPITTRVLKKQVDRSCCIRQACVGCSPEYIRNEIERCYHGEVDYICQRSYWADSIYYVDAFQTKYSDSVIVDFDYSIAKTKIELNPEYYIDGDSIEIYRDNGTLKYKGELLFVDGDLEKFPSYNTRGWCYSINGTKPTRKTNNVKQCH